jgi:hypothetical protein
MGPDGRRVLCLNRKHLETRPTARGMLLAACVVALPVAGVGCQRESPQAPANGTKVSRIAFASFGPDVAADNASQVTWLGSYYCRVCAPPRRLVRVGVGYGPHRCRCSGPTHGDRPR